MVVENLTNIGSGVSDVAAQTVVTTIDIFELIAALIPQMFLVFIISVAILTFRAIIEFGTVSFDDYCNKTQETGPYVTERKNPRVGMQDFRPDIRQVYDFETIKKQKKGLKLQIIRKLRRWASK
jgi:capsular polysaccharide biosynthesis protein